MNSKQRIAELLAKASDAEMRASKSSEPGARAAWQAIAESYRDLAKLQGQREQD